LNYLLSAKAHANADGKLLNAFRFAGTFRAQRLQLEDGATLPRTKYDHYNPTKIRT